MSNFLKFIDEDIEAKRTLFSTMPTKTKRDIKKFNEKITLVADKYEEYKKRVKKYLTTKSKSFDIKNCDSQAEEINNKVSSLERVRFILNPTNTYFEKMGFDNLIYQLSNYYDFNFKSLNHIINQFLDKFELAEVRLVGADFDYTCYVNEYMTAFLEVKNSENGSYEKVSEIFEKIYWVNPEIISHIELNFRKLIRKYEKKFNNYIATLQKKVMAENDVNNYDDCIKKLKVLYNDFHLANRENICDIINLAKAGAIDINTYFEGSKIRTSTYSALMIDIANLDNKAFTDRFYENLDKLKTNVEEYRSYVEFTPLINNFKKEYEKQLAVIDKGQDKDGSKKTLKGIEEKIADKETKLDKLNKKILGVSIKFFDFKKGDNRQLKIDSVNYANELYSLYKQYDQEYFNDKVFSILNGYLTVSELLHLYYSFDYFKKMAIKKAFEVTTYDEIVKYSDTFDLFAMNLANVIINGIALFGESNLARIIMNKYRLDNIKLAEEDLQPDELDNLLEKIQFILRINEIENSKTTIEKIWFMVQIEKIIVKENTKAKETS